MAAPSFHGRTVLVTGAGGGLGRAIAVQFAAAGAHVVALDCNGDGVETLGVELAARGHCCLALACDVTDAAACARAVDAGVARFGSLDVLVNNAGISHCSAFAATDPRVIRRVLDVNFFGAVNCTSAALPHLLAARGLVIAISSVAGFTPLVARSGYSASKHALHGFFESLRAELEPQGVATMIVCPSFIATRIERNALGGDGQPLHHAHVTVGRPLTADEAAGRIVAAASKRRRLVLIGRAARQAWWLNRFAPRLYARIMARRLRGELATP